MYVQINQPELTNFKDFISHISSLPPCTCSREERRDVHPGQYCCTRPGLSYWPWNWSLSAKPTIEKQWTGFIRYVSLLWYNVQCMLLLHFALSIFPSFCPFVSSSTNPFNLWREREVFAWWQNRPDYNIKYMYMF